MTQISFNKPLDGSDDCYRQLAILQQGILTTIDCDVLLRVTATGQADRTALFVLCTFPLLAKAHGKRLRLRLSQELFSLAQQMDIASFYQSFDSEVPPNPTKSSSFRLLNNANDIFEIVSHITKDAPVSMSDSMLNTLVSKTGEIYLNALSHSETKWIVGGKYLKSSGIYCFSCYDAGIGIPGKVNQFFTDNGYPELQDIGALEWALAEGHSTAQSADIPRGAGFQTLHSFARINSGAIRICSGGVYYTFQDGRPFYQQLDVPFIGTMFEMEIFADSKRKYILRSEVTK